MNEPTVQKKADLLKEGDLIADKYRIKTKLAEGGFGAIFHATQEPLGRDVALKILKPVDDDAEKQRERHKRFFREAAHTSRLNHPNTVMIFDYGELPDDAGFFLVMEFLKGYSLRDLMVRRGALPTEVVLHVATQIASSLSDAHAAGVVHRDLKPPNVMIVQRGDDPFFVKVVDFGLVKSLEPATEDTEELTQENTLIGSPMYMAPERFLYHNADTPSVDVYALGIMLYEMLVGRPPFSRSSDSTVHHLMMQHIQVDPPPMRKFKPDLLLPDGLESLIMKCLAKLASDRFQDMDSVLRLLRACSSTSQPLRALEADELETIQGMSALPRSEISQEAIRSEETGDTVRHTLDDFLPESATPPADTSQPLPVAPQAPVQGDLARTQLHAGETYGTLPVAPSTTPWGKISAVVLVVALAGVAALFALKGPATTAVSVQSSPPGATVVLGDKTLGITPLQLDMEVPKSTILVIKKDGYQDTEVVIPATPGDNFTASTSLRAAEAAPVEAATPKSEDSAKPSGETTTKDSDTDEGIAEKPEDSEPSPPVDTPKTKKSTKKKSTKASKSGDLDIKMDC